MYPIQGSKVDASAIGNLFKDCSAPGAGDGTNITAAFLNTVMMELLNAVTKSGQTPIVFDAANPASYNQLWLAILSHGATGGINVWTSGITDKIVFGSDGKLYLANPSGDPANNDPVGDDGTNWDGPLGSVGEALNNAMPDGCPITIPKWVAGTYAFGNVRCHNGKWYKSGADGNTAIPPSTPWEEVGIDDLFAGNVITPITFTSLPIITGPASLTVSTCDTYTASGGVASDGIPVTYEWTFTSGAICTPTTFSALPTVSGAASLTTDDTSTYTASGGVASDGLPVTYEWTTP